MQKIIDNANRFVDAAKQLSIDFNFDKLVAVLCMAVSAAISIAVIRWGIGFFF